MNDQRVRFKVEKIIRGEWEEVLSLLSVRKGDRFRIYALDGITIAKEGIACQDGFLNAEGFGQIEYEYSPGEGCDEPYTTEEMLRRYQESL